MFCNYTETTSINRGCPQANGDERSLSTYTRHCQGSPTSFSSDLTQNEGYLFSSGYFSSSWQKRRKCLWCFPGHEKDWRWTLLISLRTLTNFCIRLTETLAPGNQQHGKVPHPYLVSTSLVPALDFSLISFMPG